ncbi:MAG: hypothetical protein ABH869_07990 [Candidatus Omnitrophota bacterium]
MPFSLGNVFGVVVCGITSACCAALTVLELEIKGSGVLFESEVSFSAEIIGVGESKETVVLELVSCFGVVPGIVLLEDKKT